MFRKILGAAVGLLLMTTAGSAFGLNPGDLSITAITPFAPIDSNNCAASGPHAMYIQVRVTNTSGGTLTGLQATLNGWAASNPVPPSPPTAFTLDLGETTGRVLGTLANGASANLYYLVNYPCGAGNSQSYTVSVTDGVAPLTSGSLSLTTRSELSAAAGGDVLEQTIGLGLVTGQSVNVTVNYDFGNPSASATAMIQPVGNVSFNAACFRLKSVDITSSTFTAGPTASNDNRLYFTGVNGGSSNSLTAVYTFVALCTNTGTTLNPFADLTSGGQVKYSSNFGTCTNVGACAQDFPPATNPFELSVTASPTNLPCNGVVTYTLTITNTSNFPAVVERINDTLPAGVTFDATQPGGTVQASNSASTPSNGQAGSIEWVGQPTDQYTVPANDSITLIYSVNVPCIPGGYTNGITITTGSSTTGPASTTVIVGATPTPTEVATATATAQATATATAQSTATATEAATATATAQATATATEAATATATAQATATATEAAAATATATAESTPTPTAQATGTATATATEIAVLTCPPIPSDSCRVALSKKSTLTISKGRKTKTNSMGWRWRGTGLTTIDHVGDPSVGTSYALCLYDYSSGVPNLVMEADAPAGGVCHNHRCWTKLPKTKGYRYIDRDGTPDGIKRLAIKTTSRGNARIILRSRGVNLPVPALPVSQSPKVTAQLINSLGECWYADYSSPSRVRPRAQAKRFRDKSD